MVNYTGRRSVFLAVVAGVLLLNLKITSVHSVHLHPKHPKKHHRSIIGAASLPSPSPSTLRKFATNLPTLGFLYPMVQQHQSSPFHFGFGRQNSPPAQVISSGQYYHDCQQHNQVYTPQTETIYVQRLPQKQPPPPPPEVIYVPPQPQPTPSPQPPPPPPPSRPVYPPSQAQTNVGPSDYDSSPLFHGLLVPCVQYRQRPAVPYPCQHAPQTSPCASYAQSGPPPCSEPSYGRPYPVARPGYDYNQRPSGYPSSSGGYYPSNGGSSWSGSSSSSGSSASGYPNSGYPSSSSGSGYPNTGYPSSSGNPSYGEAFGPSNPNYNGQPSSGYPSSSSSSSYGDSSSGSYPSNGYGVPSDNAAGQIPTSQQPTSQTNSNSYGSSTGSSTGPAYAGSNISEISTAPVRGTSSAQTYGPGQSSSTTQGTTDSEDDLSNNLFGNQTTDTGSTGPAAAGTTVNEETGEGNIDVRLKPY